MIVTKITISDFKHCCHDIKVYKDRTCIQNRCNQRRSHDCRVKSDLLCHKRRMHPIHFAIATTAIIVTPRAAASIIFPSYIMQIRMPLTTARKRTHDQSHSDLLKNNLKNIGKFDFPHRQTADDQR